MSSRWSPPDSAPEPIQDALRNFTEAIESDDRVIAAFIGGSYASGEWDAYSDLDLYVVVDDDRYASFFTDRHLPLRSMGEVVLAEDFDGFEFDMVVFMLASGVEGEMGIGRSSDFAQVHGGSFEVLLDRDGILDDVAFDLQRPTPEQRERSIQRTVTWFWRLISLFATAAARRRGWTARGYLEQARREAIDLIWWIDAPDHWPGGFEKLELYPGDKRAKRLESSFPAGLDLEEQITAAGVLADFVAREGRAAYEELGRDYPKMLEATVQVKLEQLK